jgi:hypothetical protein
MGFFATSGILNQKGFFGGQDFNPSNIAGLSLWLDATTGLFDATTGGSPVTTDGATVARWEDQSGNARHISQSTAGSRPILKKSVQNGRNILRFDGVSNHLFMTSAFIYSLGASTVFCVVSQTPSSPPSANASLITERNATSSFPSYIVIGNGTSDATRLRIFMRDDANANILFSGSSTLQTASGTAFNSSYQLLGTVDTGSNIALYINKSSSVNGSYTRTTLTLDRFTVGASRTGAATAFFACDLAEIIVYNSALSTNNRQLVENYLYSKWGIP